MSNGTGQNEQNTVLADKLLDEVIVHEDRYTDIGLLLSHQDILDIRRFAVKIIASGDPGGVTNMDDLLARAFLIEAYIVLGKLPKAIRNVFKYRP